MLYLCTSFDLLNKFFSMSNAAARILLALARFFLWLTVFLTPLFVLPFTAEVFEFNKQFLFYGLTLITLLLWLVQSVLSRAFVFRRTILDIPVLVLWVAMLISSVFSLDRRLSFLGDFAFLDGGFLSFTFVVIFFFLLTQLADSPARMYRMLWALLSAGFVSTLYFFARVIAATRPAWDAKFGTLVKFVAPSPVSASIALFAIFLALMVSISFAILVVKKQAWKTDFVSALFFLTGYAALVLIGFKVGWVAAGLGLVLTLVYAIAHLDRVRMAFLSAGFVLAIVAILFAFLGEPRFLQVPLPVEVTLSPSVSWDIAWNTFVEGAKQFFVGSGPATFVYDFSQFRPESFNLNPIAWSIRFREPYNTLLAVSAEGGLLGLLAFLFVVLMAGGVLFTAWIRRGGAASAFALRKKNGEEDFRTLVLPFGVAPAWCMLFIAMFLTNFSTVLLLAFWLLTAIVVVGSGALAGSLRTHTVGLKAQPQYVLAASFSLILVFTIAVVLGIYLGRFYAGEVVYAKALRTADPSAKIQILQRARELNPLRTDYDIELARSYFTQAQLAANVPQPNPQAVTTYVALAVNEAKRATDRAPANVTTWETLARLYANARIFAPDANAFAVKAYAKALELEPSNPVLAVGLGEAHAFENRITEAKEAYERAIVLKPDYLEPYLRLARLHEKLGETDKAIASLERGFQFVQNNADYAFEMGRLYFNRGKGDDLARAEGALVLANQWRPDFSNALFTLGLVLERRGNTTMALQLYREVARLNPGNQDIKKRINALAPPPPPPPKEE